jgi:hydroxypyruvate isomerase
MKMTKFSLCIEPALTDLDFYDRIPAAADLGFDAIEFWDPAGKDIPRIARLAADHHIAISICCVKDAWKKSMNAPASVVVANIHESIAIAKDLGCHSLIALAGEIEGKADSQKTILIENLKRVADIAVKENVTINMEALNSLVDHKGYYLDSSAISFEIMKTVGCGHIRLLYDVYHMQIMEGNLIANITKNIDFIGHFHSAGVPGRHEVFTGEIAYPNIIKAIDNAGYERFFGLEYWPTYDHRQSLADTLKYLKG